MPNETTPLLNTNPPDTNMRSPCRALRNTFTLKTLKKRVPILLWLPYYNVEKFIQDVIAGISVGLTAIPQGIAYAGVAGLDLQYGLYSGFMGCFVYLIFGSCKDLTIGPTAIVSLMTQRYAANYGPDFAVLLTFLSGCIVLALGLFNLGFLLEFISMPVTTAFTTAAAITIAATQMHSLFGYKGSPSTFLEACINFAEEIHTIKLWDSIIGVSTIVILLLARELRRYGSRTCPSNTPWYKSLFLKFNWLMSLGRNAVVIIVGCLMAWIFSKYDLEPFTLTGPIEGGLPPFQPPPFSTVYNNVTYHFMDMVQVLGPSIITIALVGILEAVAIAKAFSMGKILDSTQEMCALGLCNMFGSFVRSMPTTGSFTRTVINHASGVQTTAGGIFTGALVLMALSFLTETFQYIPKAVLAGLIITAMIFMVELDVIPMFWRSKKIELLPFLGTTITCLLLGLEIGILIGVCLNIAMLLARTARPKVEKDMTKVNGKDVLLVVPDDDLLYCSADYFSKKVMSVAFTKENMNNKNFMVVIDGCRVRQIDVTVAKNIKVLLESLKSRNQMILLWRFGTKVENVLKGVYSEASKRFIYERDLDDVIRVADANERLTSLSTE